MRSPRADRLVITPALDLMQTIPTFAYLIPMLLLFGNSPVSALLATGLFATPPMVRATMLGLRKVPPEIKDFADMAGCTALQKLWRVLIPSAKPSLMVGVNQVIMLALNMVIISSMIGAGGLGYDVLLALRALKVGQAMEAGLAIVVARHRARPAEPGCRRRSPQRCAAAARAPPDAGGRGDHPDDAAQPPVAGPCQGARRHDAVDGALVEGGHRLGHRQLSSMRWRSSAPASCCMC